MQTIEKPVAGEFKPFTAAYINQIKEPISVNDYPVLFSEMKSFLQSIPDHKLEYRYAEGKWTIKESLVHMIDTERIFSYRALRIARNDTTPLPGFDQDVYVPHSNANARTLTNILEEWEAVRQSSYFLFASFNDAAWNRVGTSSEHRFGVKAFFYIIAGHAQHHINIIRERYLS